MPGCSGDNDDKSEDSEEGLSSPPQTPMSSTLLDCVLLMIHTRMPALPPYRAVTKPANSSSPTRSRERYEGLASRQRLRYVSTRDTVVSRKAHASH